MERSQPEKPTLGPVFGFVFGGILVGLIVGGVIALLWSFLTSGGLGSHKGSSGVAVFWFVSITIAVIASTFAVYAYVEDSKKYKEAIDRNARVAADARRHETERKRAEIGAAISKLYRTREQAVIIFEKLPEQLQEANQLHGKSRQYYSDGAFSPFWEAVEGSYGALANYADGIKEILRCIKLDEDTRRYLCAVGVSSATLNSFPVTIRQTAAMEAATEVSNALAATVYNAQRQFQFAQIWEQRRTTTAIEKGFKNLETAVKIMTATIASSINDLSLQIAASATEVNNSVASSIDRNSNEVSQLLSRQLREQQDLNGRVARAARELGLSGAR